MPAANGVDEVALLRALGDPTRLRVFRALRERERCVRDLVRTEGLSQPLVSHHLRVLVDAGLVRARRWEGFTMYALAPEGMRAALDALRFLLDPGDLDELALPGGNATCCQPGSPC